MDCPTCKTSNPAEAGFCMKCGSPLTRTCPQCGTGLPAEAQFCHKCGHRLDGTQPEAAQDRLQQYIPKELLAKLESARSGGGMQGERRVVTMLFCDVQGSTAAAERLDPEEWAEIMNGAFEHLIAPVYQYEGTLARLMGDAVLAFFGAPIAHEDDPQRAILAGLEIIKSIAPYRDQVKHQWDLDFNVRIGINTGLVVVGEVGTDLRVEYTAMGDAVNLAARMEQTAEPGTVRVTENTYRQVAPLFDVESLGPVEVKGKAEPVPAFRVLGPKAAPGRLRGIEGLDAPLVGRDREMGQLREAISALAQGHGQILSVMGEAGLGKSRLMAELRQSLVSDGLLREAGAESSNGGPSTTISWHEGRSISYQTSVPYASFVDMLSKIMGLVADQTDVEKYNQIKEHVSAVVAPELVLEVAPFIATLLGIDLEGEEAERTRYLAPPQMRGKVFTAMGLYIEGLVAVRPTVLVFEDLHWIDPTSLELLEQLLPLTDRVPLTIIALFRPVRQEPSWRFHEVAVRDFGHRYAAVQLDPLDSENSRILVAHLLEVEDLPEKVRDLILTKTEGNPFFVEEVIRSLLDSGLVVKQDGHWRATREIENITVPDTLAGVITARVDRLDEESRRVVQTASVIGREFQLGTLADIYPAPEALESALTDLQRRELVREKSRLPQPVYTFKHALTQETVYASVLLSRRRELNLQVAESLARSDPEQANDIARHFLEARENDRALPYLVQAGERAARSYSTPEAIGLFTRALEIIGTTGDVQMARRAYEGLGGALTFGGDVPRAVETYDKMLHFA